MTGTTSFDTFDEALGRYERALALLQEWGIRVSATSRLLAYRNRLRAAVQDPAPDVSHADALRLMFDLREIDEITEIVQAFRDRPTAAETSRLSLLHVDHQHPDEGTSTKSRDAQFELFLRALLLNAGLTVTMQEPDLVVQDGRLTYSLAAKRPASLARVDDRLRSAASQIAHFACPGVVAISLDQVLRPRKTYLSLASKHMLAQSIAGQVDLFARENREVIRSRVEGRPVAGVFLSTVMPGLSAPKGAILRGRNLHLIALHASGGSPSPIADSMHAAMRAYYA